MKKIITSVIFYAGVSCSCFAQPTVSTDSIIQTSLCAGGNVIVPFTVSGGVFNFGNVFTAQLSNAFGQFTNPVNIGVLPYWSSGAILGTIPINTNFGVLYKIRVIASNPSDTGTSCPNTLVVAHIAQLNQIIAIPADTACVGDSIILSCLYPLSSYLWSTGETTFSIKVFTSGVYSVVSTDLAGCESTAYDTVFFKICAGIEENELNNYMLIYPNPTSENLFIKWNNPVSTSVNLALYDLLGREVCHYNNLLLYNKAEKQIDLSALAPDIYFLKIENKDKKIFRKIIIQALNINISD